MASVSYPRAIASCLPIVGPLVAAYYGRESSSNVELFCSTTALALRRLQEGARPTEQLGQAISNHLSSFRNENLPKCERQRIYAICGLVGSALSSALMVGLIALGIFSRAEALPLACAFLFHVFLHAWDWSSASSNINKLQNLTAAHF
jgi:hypothetical protein